MLLMVYVVDHMGTACSLMAYRLSLMVYNSVFWANHMRTACSLTAYRVPLIIVCIVVLLRPYDPRPQQHVDHKRTKIGKQ
eukprot:6454267-Amphidinium_carterae.1